MDIDTEVYVVEDGVGVLSDTLCWSGVGLLLDVDDLSWVLNNERYFVGDGVLLNFVDGKLTDVGDFVWHLDLGGVVLPELDDVWLIDGDGVVHALGDFIGDVEVLLIRDLVVDGVRNLLG